MKQYCELLQRVLNEGEERTDRTNTGTLSVFGGHMEFDLRESFPLVTVKLTRWQKSFVEMLWFIRGEPHTKYLKDNNVGIWDDWADEQGNLGPVYGVQWRSWPGRAWDETVILDDGEVLNPQDGNDLPAKLIATVQRRDPNIDQLANLIRDIKSNPRGRRHIVTAWNPADLHLMGLPPCHRDFQCYVSNDGHLDLMWSQRSWDLGLGAPFNIAQYALLTHLIARATGLKPRKLMVNYGDAHLYLNHVEKIREMLKTQQPRECNTQLIINTDNTDIDGYKIEDFDIIGYESGPFVSLPIAV